MALTLDMGGRLDPGIDILNLLITNHVCVTIFPTGAMAQTTQGQQVMAIIRAHPELFEIGNHTMHHCDLVKGGGGSPTSAPCAGVTPTADFIRKELTDAAAILTQLTAQQPVPYCARRTDRWSRGSRRGCIRRVHEPSCGTSTSTGSRSPTVATANRSPAIDGNARDGSIVLLHLGGWDAGRRR